MYTLDLVILCAASYLFSYLTGLEFRDILLGILLLLHFELAYKFNAVVTYLNHKKS